MKTIAGILLALALSIPGVNDIAKVNKLKKEAESAFLAGDYGKASEAYTYLTDSLGLTEDEVFMNLGHSLFRQGDSARAFSQYQRLVTSPNKTLKSAALNQMGVISNKPGDRASALNFFKEALKANPGSDEARYNYQLVKRQIEQEKEQNQEQQQEKQNEEQKQDEQQQEKQDQQQKNDQQNQEQKDQEQQQKDQESEDKEQKDQEKKDPKQESKEKPEDEKKQDQEAEQKENDKKDGEEKPQQINPDKLKEMNISEEKARMILEAMRNSEIQYIQQNKRKATKKPESGKPDW